METESWYTLKGILADVQEMDASSRQAFLDSAPITAGTRRKIESFLAREDEGKQFLSVPAGELLGDSLPHDAGPKFLGQIGVYDIVRELGLGGMGAVYLAKRRDGKFDQQVAIKLLKREFNAGHLRKSFDREIRIQSKLVHPNIAQILDTDVTEDGIPYIVMEYVDGLPIDKYCSRHSLSLRERLKLFNRACEAVSFAHQQLVVHRDLKPSNILVAADGSPKLLDFGISKLLDADDADAVFTMLGAMTPHYASPEQIKGHPVGTTTDIYSLGVILYKLLTGTLPYDVKLKFNGDLLKEITDSEPIPASSAVASVDPASRPPFAGTALKGDLDNILLKALGKLPHERYSTVQQLTADIWNYLDGRPVEARPATKIYRLAKFYNRNKAAVTAAALVLVSLIAGIGISSWQTSVARASADAAAEARLAAVAESDNAKAEQRKSEKISRFMMRFISYANPHWHAEGYRFGGEARVIDALNDMASKIDTEFADQPDVLAELHHQFCDAYAARRETDAARAHALRALELRRAYYGDSHELVAKDMAFVYWTSAKPQTDDSVRMLSDAIVMMRSTNPKNLNLPYMLEEYVDRLTNDGKMEWVNLFQRHLPQPAPGDRLLAADQFFDEMVGLLRQHFAEDSMQIVYQKCRGSVLKLRVDKLAEAEDLYQACKQDSDNKLASGTYVNPTRLRWLDEYRKLTGKNN